MLTAVVNNGGNFILTNSSHSSSSTLTFPSADAASLSVTSNKTAMATTTSNNNNSSSSADNNNIGHIVIDPLAKSTPNLLLNQETTLSIAPFGRRKSIPSKSISRDDSRPGLHFRIGSSPDSDTITIITAPPSMPSSTDDSHYYYYHQYHNTKENAVNLNEAWDLTSRWGDLWKNSHNSRATALTSGTTAIHTSGNYCPQNWERPRSRSLSLLDRRRASATTTTTTAPVTTIVTNGELESDDTETGSPNQFFMTNSNLPSTKRRASIGSTTTSSLLSTSLPVGSYYGGSLAHLVPNQFLQTTSRRISTHGTATGCMCTSCGSTVTPYWRDGWAPDVMLCNACGLRFQKFARRCPACVYIPRKEDSLGDRCVKCGQFWVVGPSHHYHRLQ